MIARSPTSDDAEAIAGLLAACASAYGFLPAGADEVRSWFAYPELTAEDFHVVEAAGRLVAYADLTLRQGRDAAWLDARVAPGGPLDAVLAWAEERAGARGARLLRAAVPAAADASPLQARGYRPIRHFFEMAVALDEEPAAPVWPAGVGVRTLRPGEEERAHAASEESFEDHWEFEPRSFENWLGGWNARGYDPALWFLAVDGGEIAGVCLCALRGANDARAGWVNILGVRRPWRRLGLGAALLLHAFREFRARDLRLAGLDVDGENTTGAVGLYERVGMHVSYRQDCWELRLR